MIYDKGYVELVMLRDVLMVRNIIQSPWGYWLLYLTNHFPRLVENGFVFMRSKIFRIDGAVQGKQRRKFYCYRISEEYTRWQKR